LSNSFFGMLLAASASMFWTVTPLFFASAGRRIGAYNVNVIRLCLATLFLGAISAVYLAVNGGLAHCTLPAVGIFWLAISGISGLVIGDIFYLNALTMIGPRRTLQIFLLTPIVPVAIAWMTLGERLSMQELFGIALILSGIAYSTFSENGSARAPTAEPGVFSVKGIVYAGVATLFQGIGAVLARQAFLAVPALDPIVATTVRVASAAVAFCIVAVLMGRLPQALRSFRQEHVARSMLLGASTGPVAGMMLYVAAFKFTAAGIVSTLSSLSPLLILPVIALRYKVRIRKESIIGALVAIAGVAVMALGK
jgi:drug/metabolite transporter (DMT)-like permease